VPPWLSALTAVAATIVTAVGVFGLVGERTATPTTASQSIPAAARVTLESVLVSAQTVEAQGSFENIDPFREDVLFVGRPQAATTDLWVAVEAALAPSAQAGSLQSGRWTAQRPQPPADAYRWRAIVWPSAQGSAGNEDLQQNGPDSQFVIARSDETITP
jgi:hypothetical protein